MLQRIHFSSGLSRPGSTLLSALLRQNPRFRIGAPGPHSVCGKVETGSRKTVLRPDPFQRFADGAFWRDPDRLPGSSRIA